ncbi:ImmA/IrrE family metallo-endopeptidase [Subtercola sp. YIM 133946]|uniref:ImmA/IrrE family metallo-endopeptidase n=1 Tax=Subtercola sp. YIM 133946 TaxID=3118909 RepID=UPI002F92EEE0
MYDPFEHADRLNIEVVFGRLRTAHGLWIPERRTIILKRGMRALHERSILAHELGHVCLGHDDSTPRNEFLADRWAARHLIAPDHLAAIARVHTDQAQWCLELDVTPHMLETYLSLPLNSRQEPKWLGQKSSLRGSTAASIA